MAQKVDHSALWMYVPNAGGVGVPTYFKPTEGDGATVGKHPGPWLVGGGLTNMLLTPHEGESGIDVSFWPDGQVDKLFWYRPYEDQDLWITTGTSFSSYFSVVFTPDVEGPWVECGWVEFPVQGEARAIPARIPGWSGELYVSAIDESWDGKSFFVNGPHEESFGVDIVGYGYDPLPSNPSIEFTFPAGFFYIGDKTSDEIVISIPLAPM